MSVQCPLPPNQSRFVDGERKELTGPSVNFVSFSDELKDAPSFFISFGHRIPIFVRSGGQGSPGREETKEEFLLLAFLSTVLVWPESPSELLNLSQWN